jgi:branched-chain amino acid transport system substrate-binding protein
MKAIVLATRRLTLFGSAAVLAGLSRRAKAEESIKIGMLSPLTGVGAESGRNQRQGAQLALDAINSKGGVMGRPLEFVIEDDQTTNPGSVLAFSRLAARPGIVAVIGSVRSTQVQAVAPDVLRAGKPMMFGGTDPSLTQMGNPWLFRCRPNDTYSAKVIAAYGVKTLGLKKWAIVYSTDSFGSNGNKALVTELNALGVEPVLDQGYANQSPDFTPVALAVKQSGADILSGYFTFEVDNATFARQRLQMGVRIPWIGGVTLVNYSTLKLAGPALNGVYAVPDYAVDANPASKAFAEAYNAKYGVLPDNQSAWSFDATNILARAMADSNSTDPEKIRSAILTLRGYQGAEGEYNYDRNGDGLHGYNIVHYENGKINYLSRIDFPA